MYQSITELARNFFAIAVPHADSTGNTAYRLVSPGRRSRRARQSKPGYQGCEPRMLLAGIDFTAATGQIVIGGTAADDIAIVSQTNDTVTVTQAGYETRTFEATDVNSILFVGLRGDDYFENRTSIPSIAFGKNGNDTLIGGSGNDRLFGNGDNDIIRGNGGDDFLVAGIGDDNIHAGDGNDRILGIGGSNIIVGGVGDDLIYGGVDADFISDATGNNTLVGNGGDDSIVGGSGVDYVYGGQGDDLIAGGGGNDRIYAQAGNDSVAGGSGTDVVAGNDGDDILQGEIGNDRVVGGQGNDRVNYFGSRSGYEVRQSGPNLWVRDLSGFDLAPDDLVIGVEQMSFLDGIVSADMVLDPTVQMQPAEPFFQVPERPADTYSWPVHAPFDAPRTPGDPHNHPFHPSEPPTDPDPDHNHPTQPVDPNIDPFAPPPQPQEPIDPSGNAREVVIVQPIIASNTNGSNQAEFFGNAQQEQDIKTRIDDIFAQANIDVEFLPTRFVNDTFTNVGTSTGERAGADLDRIVTGGDASGVGNTDPLVIDMYFVEHVPGFADLGDMYANGLAFLGGNGIAMHVGDNLVDTEGGRSVVASVAAHEIGHNLGLDHYPGDQNLMSSAGNSTDLTQGQIDIVINSRFSQPL